ncbi:NlpC/P60 family protein [Pseudoroseicyclus sp. CXY001]|uniref:NlpC/P60 family protein n=1 Tax=Pseudoroseicyclus sp. CXY001 TaxID=3242492 RepID=UPI0035712AA6
MSEVVTRARAWIGTPYGHQASCRGAGADCLGLLLGLWREIHGELPEAVPAYRPDWGEVRGEELLLQAALRHLRPATTPAPGDVLLFRMRAGSIAKHVGLAAETGAAPTFIHSYQGHGVVESALTAPWARRIAARFAFPAGD